MGAEKIVKSFGNLLFAVEDNMDAGSAFNNDVMNSTREEISNTKGYSSVSHYAFMKVLNTSHDNSDFG